MSDEIEKRLDEVTNGLNQLGEMFNKLAPLVENLNLRLQQLEAQQNLPPSEEDIIKVMEEHGIDWNQAERKIMREKLNANTDG